MWSEFLATLDKATKETSGSARAELIRGVVRLDSSLRSCHAAYLRHEREPTDENVRDWASAIDALALALAAMRTTLQPFDPKLFESLAHYTDSEIRMAAVTSPRYLVDYHQHLFEDLDLSSARSDFRTAIELLGSFIRSHFTMEEIFPVPSE